jgi:hypothetical protein
MGYVLSVIGSIIALVFSTFALFINLVLLRKQSCVKDPSSNVVIYLCTPFRGPDKLLNIDFARRVARELSLAGAVVFVPHLHSTQFLNDDVEDERDAGIDGAKEFMERCADEVWSVLPPWRKEFSTGMKIEDAHASTLLLPQVICNTEQEYETALADLRDRLSDLRGKVAA